MEGRWALLLLGMWCVRAAAWVVVAPSCHGVQIGGASHIVWPVISVRR